MSARSIGEIVAPIIVDAIGIANLQDFLECFPDPRVRKQWIMDWWQGGTISGNEAELLIEYNNLEAA